MPLNMIKRQRKKEERKATKTGWIPMRVIKRFK